VVSVSGFLDSGGVDQILVVWVIDMMLIILATGLQSLIIDRFGRLTVIRWMIFSFVVIYIILRLLFMLQVPDWLNYALLYLLTDQQWLFFPLVFWVLANDILSPAQAKRLFPVIASGGFAGKLLGLCITIVSPNLFSRLGLAPAELLTLNVLLFLSAYLVAIIGLRTIRLRQTTFQPETVRETLTEGWDFVRAVPSFRYLMLSILALAMCDTIVEFRFLVVSDEAYTGLTSYQTFYGTFKLGLTVVSLLVQSLLTSRLIDRVDLKNSFFFLPAALLGGTLWMMASPGLVSGIGATSLFKLTNGTINESARKSFQGLVPEERRGRVSMFMDSYLLAVGTILGSLVTGAIVWIGLHLGSTNYFYGYLGVSVIAALFSIWAIFMMRQVYDSSLFNWRLKRRQRRASVLDKLEL
jgi:hypothetical protein